MVLLRYAGVSDGVGRAIFSGTRAKGMMEFIKAIADNTDNVTDKQLADIDFVFPQLAAINTARDEIVHHATGGSMSLDDKGNPVRYITNARRINRYSKANKKIIGVAALADMMVDLANIMIHLDRHSMTRNENFQAYEKNGAQTTWLYKPPQPEAVSFGGRAKRPPPKPTPKPPQR